MKATCILSKNIDGCMDGTVGRQSRRLKEEDTRKMWHTGKYHFEEEPYNKTTTGTLYPKFSVWKISLKQENN